MPRGERSHSLRERSQRARNNFGSYGRNPYTIRTRSQTAAMRTALPADTSPQLRSAFANADLQLGTDEGVLPQLEQPSLDIPTPQPIRDHPPIDYRIISGERGILPPMQSGRFSFTPAMAGPLQDLYTTQQIILRQVRHYLATRHGEDRVEAVILEATNWATQQAASQFNMLGIQEVAPQINVLDGLMSNYAIYTGEEVHNLSAAVYRDHLTLNAIARNNAVMQAMMQQQFNQISNLNVSLLASGGVDLTDPDDIARFMDRPIPRSVLQDIANVYRTADTIHQGDPTPANPSGQVIIPNYLNRPGSSTVGEAQLTREVTGPGGEGPEQDRYEVPPSQQFFNPPEPSDLSVGRTDVGVPETNLDAYSYGAVQRTTNPSNTDLSPMQSTPNMHATDGPIQFVPNQSNPSRSIDHVHAPSSGGVSLGALPSRGQAPVPDLNDQFYDAVEPSNLSVGRTDVGVPPMSTVSQLGALHRSTNPSNTNLSMQSTPPLPVASTPPLPVAEQMFETTFFNPNGATFPSSTMQSTSARRLPPKRRAKYTLSNSAPFGVRVLA